MLHEEDRQLCDTPAPSQYDFQIHATPELPQDQQLKFPHNDQQTTSTDLELPRENHEVIVQCDLEINELQAKSSNFASDVKNEQAEVILANCTIANLGQRKSFTSL